LFGNWNCTIFIHFWSVISCNRNRYWFSLLSTWANIFLATIFTVTFCVCHLQTWSQNKTTQWLEVFKIYPKADFNNARYPIMNQVRHAGSYPSRWKESSNNLS
jgi:hypothetical protein